MCAKKYTVVIDADHICYKLGFALEDVNSKGTVRKHVNEYLLYIQETLEKLFVNIEKPIIVLSPLGTSNFRFALATIKPYKGNRTTPKPKHYGAIREMLLKMDGCICKEGQEADDTVADIAYKSPMSTVIVSADKDLRQVPGWHFEPGEKRPVYYVDDDIVGHIWLEKMSGDKTILVGVGSLWHLAQAVLGDTADNIPGISKWGPVKVYNLFKSLDFGMSLCTAAVQDLYIKQYGGDVDEGMRAFDEVMTLLQMGGHSNKSL